MKKGSRTMKHSLRWIPGVLLLACCFAAITSSQAVRSVQLPDETAGIDNIARVLISTFDQVDVLALADTHQRKIDSDLRLAVVRDPEFAQKVHFILVEFANTVDQPTLDRYINGENVPPGELQQVWRNTCCGGVWDSPVYAEFLAAVRDLNKKLPLLAAALPFVGHFQTRNKGTVCGSIAHADPSSEIPLSLATLEGDVVLRGKRGERVLKAKDFQLDMMTTARDGDELIVAVRFPVHGGTGVAFREVARRHGDFAMVAVAAFIEDQGSVRLGIGGMAGTPVVRRIAMNGLKDAVEKIVSELEGYEDLHASAELRRDILRNLAPVVIAEAQQCAA